MDKPSRIAQVYGYTVCLVALVVAIISVPMLVNACFDRANPLQSQSGFGVSLTSFETYKATYQRERIPSPGAGAAADSASDDTLRRRYDALVADRLAATRYRTSKALFTASLLLLLAVGLFGFHWRWVKRFANGAAGSA